MPSPPSSKASASTMPGSGQGVPAKGLLPPGVPAPVLLEEPRGTIVESPDGWPGEECAQVDALMTIWSKATPSSRVCTRRVCVPVEANDSIGLVSQYAPSCHPQPESPHPEQFSRFRRRPALVLMAYSGSPLTVASLN